MSALPAPGTNRPAGSRLQFRLARLSLVLALAAALGGCAHRAKPPSAESQQPRPVALSGLRVMVLPSQPAPTTPESFARGFDAELAYWLADRAPRVHWIPAAELERLVKASPALNMDLHGLDVRAFGRMRVQRIGDPLFGDVHNLGGVVDARLALLPASVAYVPPKDRASSEADGRFEVTAALIETFGGDVVWFAVAAGEPGPMDSPAALASAAQALARSLTTGR